MNGRDGADCLATLDEAAKEAEVRIFISGDKVLDWIRSWSTENEFPVPEPDIFPEQSL